MVQATKKINYTLRNKKSAEESHDEKSDYAAKQLVAHKNYTRKIVTQKRGFVNES